MINNNKGVLNGNNHGDGIITGKSCESCQGMLSEFPLIDEINLTLAFLVFQRQTPANGTPGVLHICSTNSATRAGRTGRSMADLRIHPEPVSIFKICFHFLNNFFFLKQIFCLGENEADLKKKSGSISDEEKIPSSIASHRPHRCTMNGCGKEFKLKAHLVRHYATAHGVAIRSGSPRPIMKTRNAFYLHTTPLTRISRRLCRHIMLPRHAARSPFWPINVPAIKQECKF